MPKKTSGGELSHDQLVYLAGMWDVNVSFRSTGNAYAVSINNAPDWPASMASLYGGEARELYSSKGRLLHGWYLDPGEKLDIMELLEKHGLIQAEDATRRDTVRGKLEKASGRGLKG